MYNILKAYHKYVNYELSLGGGKLFKQIAAQDKAFLNVSWETHGGGATNPEDFLHKQKELWSSFWNPDDADLKHRLALVFKQLRLAAVEHNQHNPIIFGLDELDGALTGYRKETLGSDIWKPSELRRLPNIS